MKGTIRTMARSGARRFILITFTVLLFFGAIGTDCVAYQSQKPAKGASEGRSVLESLVLPKQFKNLRTHKTVHGDYRITLRHYSYDAASEVGVSGLAIEYVPDSALLYYELGYPPPDRRTPMTVFKQKKGPDLLILHTVLIDRDKNPTMLKVYELEEPYNHSALRIGGGYAYELKDLIGDFDGDGRLDVLNLELKIAGTDENMGMGAEFGVRSVYRYVPGGGTAGRYYPSPQSHFERVKGRVFEKYFMHHAQKLIDKDYPEILSRKEKGDPSKATHLKREGTRLLEAIVLNWLATVESTQNPEQIAKAILRLEMLPFPDPQRKRELLNMLVRSGYHMLKQE